MLGTERNRPLPVCQQCQASYSVGRIWYFQIWQRLLKNPPAYVQPHLNASVAAALQGHVCPINPHILSIALKHCHGPFPSCLLLCINQSTSLYMFTWRPDRTRCVTVCKSGEHQSGCEVMWCKSARISILLKTNKLTKRKYINNRCSCSFMFHCWHSDPSACRKWYMG